MTDLTTSLTEPKELAKYTQDFEIGGQRFTFEITDEDVTVKKHLKVDTGLKDILNRSIREGDMVAYPVRPSYGVYLSTGRVVGKTEYTNKLRVEVIGRWSKKKKIVTVERLDRVVRVG